MSANVLERPYTILREQPYPLLFVTLSGSHLYGFPSADSDFDLRGVHVVPAPQMLGLDQPAETVETKTEVDGFEDEMVTHDATYIPELIRQKTEGYEHGEVYVACEPGYTLGMRKLLIAAAASAALVCVPLVAAAAPLQINVAGFERIVPYATTGDTCDVLPIHGDPTAVNCPDGSRGTLTLYTNAEDTPVCEVDYWYQGNRWHAITAKQNGGTCAIRWGGGYSTLTISTNAPAH
jgi:hypothetical protein